MSLADPEELRAHLIAAAAAGHPLTYSELLERLGYAFSRPKMRALCKVLAAVDFPRIERAVREILIAVGEDPDREGLLETPARVARMYAEMFAGLKQDPREHTRKFFTEQYDEVVLVRDISFCSMSLL